MTDSICSILLTGPEEYAARNTLGIDAATGGKIERGSSKLNGAKGDEFTGYASCIMQLWPGFKI